MFSINWTDTEKVFKRKPNTNELKNFLSSIVTTFETKLNKEYVKAKFDNQTKYNDVQNLTDIYLINNTFRDILREVSSSATSQLLSASNRYLKRPYSKKISDKIVLLHGSLEDINDKILQPESSASITLVLVGILIAQYLKYNAETETDNGSCSPVHPSISWYYGDYNMILDKIQEETDGDAFWMDDELTWEGYVNEDTIVIILNENNDENIVKYYLKSVNIFLNVKNIRRYVLVSDSSPSQVYIDVISDKNVHQFTAD